MILTDGKIITYVFQKCHLFILNGQKKVASLGWNALIGTSQMKRLLGTTTFYVVICLIILVSYCSWVGMKDTKNHCLLPGVSAACPITCEICETCADPDDLRFNFLYNGNEIVRNCYFLRCVAGKEYGRCIVVPLRRISVESLVVFAERYSHHDFLLLLVQRIVFF